MYNISCIILPKAITSKDHQWSKHKFKRSITKRSNIIHQKTINGQNIIQKIYNGKIQYHPSKDHQWSKHNLRGSITERSNIIHQKTINDQNINSKDL